MEAFARYPRLACLPELEPVWVPVDFERERLADGLADAGHDPLRATFVTWLGVTPFLSRDAILATLRELPPCWLGVGYVPPLDAWDERLRASVSWMPGKMAELGEPWLSLLTPQDLAGLLAEAGFSMLEDLGSEDVEPRYGLPALNYERLALARKEAA